MARLDIRRLFKSVLQEIRIFFNKQKWEEILIFLCFALLSAGFWYLESLQEEYEIEIEMPVKYKNVPRDVILSDDHPQNLSVRIRDKGTVLINYMWFNSFSPVEVDMKDAHTTKDATISVEKRTVESAISRQLISSTSLLRIEPSAIQVDYTKLMQKDVTVQADVDFQAEPGYHIAGAILVNPAKVHAYAVPTILDTLHIIKTAPVELKHTRKTVTLTVRLEPIPNVRMEPEKVEITIPVEEFTEKRLQIPVRCRNMPDNYNLRVFPSSVEVICNIPMSKYKDLENSDVEIQIPFQEFDANRASGSVPIRLTKYPEWIINPLINPGTVEFILEKKT
ncbi:MAG: YbbR-like domain-containing protein [Tannerella sp.]|jgi:YbbR domain-containing protein|nr:YbbR-like domain-containing protein [Tannerella sp.]